MIFNEPDCTIDEDSGHLIWSSLKDIDTSMDDLDNTKVSEGWEFLVECKRSQATDLLREAPSGCFLIRPHADDGVEEDEIFSPDTSADELSDFDNVEKPRRIK